MQTDYDYIVIGSGFGGSVSALRLTEKGYRVAVLEKGKRLSERDFPKRNWNLRKWLWMPVFRFFGFFRISWFRHITVLSGVGVGGGSLVYANTLLVPGSGFFRASSWAHLADWEAELAPFYSIASQMLGAVPCPRLEAGDRGLETLAGQLGKEHAFARTNVAVFFGEPEKTVSDPYFGGKGPDRAGCTFCGGCMVGCRFNAKNTLTKNYLYLAEGQGLAIMPEREVYDVVPVGNHDGSDGYRVKWKSSTSILASRGEFTCRGVVFAGGVLGTVPLLLKLRASSLPNMSSLVGTRCSTNSESLFGVTAFDRVFSDGVAISSILKTDEHTHLEPVRYPSGSGFWRILQAPLVPGNNFITRLFRIVFDLFRHPLMNLKVLLVDDWAKRTQILLFMRTLDSTLRFSRGLFGLKTSLERGAPPRALDSEAVDMAVRYAGIVKGKPMALLTESLLGIPTTAHILGGAVMGTNASEGVIDKDNRVFGYHNLYVCDGSMISANPGVNPALTIAALAERAMSRVPDKAGAP